jgi:phospholipid/cholesterol/gamma-HCH transport system substrate-binding protein
VSRRVWPLALAVVIAFAVSSCASISVDALPQPGNAYPDGYDIVVEFESVLNLPARAKVVMDGTTVGVVTDVALKSQRVDVTARIDHNVSIPSDIHAALQQATVLGDIYVALDRPHTDQPLAPPLASGATIALPNTTSPPQLEDTIATLANFVSSGSIQRVQNTIIGLNRVTPSGDAARTIASRVATDLSDLSNNMDLVDQWLQGLSGTADVLHNRLPSLQYFVSPNGLKGFDRTTQSLGYVGTLLPSLGSVYSQGYWLLPLLNSLGGAVGAMQRDKQGFEAEVPAWRRLFYEDFLPQDKYPAMNITSIVGPDGRELSGNVQDVLRILGAAP